MIKSWLIKISLGVALLLSCAQVWAGTWLVDQGQRIKGLWVYPNLQDPLVFHYIPERAQLVRNDDGQPKFNLTFYVSDAGDSGAESVNKTISQASGGALLHLLMEYHTSPELVEDVQQALREQRDNDQIVLAGPVAFHEGQYTIISSTLEQGASNASSLLAQKPAPVLEGNRVAISANLNPQAATLLLATLNGNTADLSVSYDLAFSGLSDAYDATMEIDWEKVSQSVGGGGGGTVYFISLDVEAQVDRLFQDGAIKLQVNGDDTAMDKLVETAHAKALDMLFSPVDIEDEPEAEQAGLMDMVTGLIDGKNGLLSSGNTTGFGAYANFKLKDIRSTGTSTLNFNKRASTVRHAILTANIGGLVQEFGNDPQFINYVSTHDSAFDLRKVFVKVDGLLAPEVGDFVNSIEVTLHKEHSDERSTTRQLLISDQALEEDFTLGPLTYNNLEGQEAQSWLSYNYQTRWNFEGGGVYESELATSSGAMINLDAPYRRQQVFIEGDAEKLSQAGIRAVVIEISYDFFGDAKPIRRIVKISNEPFDVEPVELTLPKGNTSYDYEITWLRPGSENLISSGRDNLGFLFIDELPEAN